MRAIASIAVGPSPRLPAGAVHQSACPISPTESRVSATGRGKGQHTGRERFRQGESTDEALIRYANALRRLLSWTETVTLLVVHGFALRNIAASATTSWSRSADPPCVNAPPCSGRQRRLQGVPDVLESVPTSSTPNFSADGFLLLIAGVDPPVNSASALDPKPWNSRWARMSPEGRWLHGILAIAGGRA
jgi:hypothetical protein